MVNRRKLLMETIQNGSIETLKQFSLEEICQAGSSHLYTTAERGHLSFLKHYHKHIKQLDTTGNFIDYAAKGGHFHIVKYLDSLNCQMTGSGLDWVVEFGKSKEHAEILEFYYKRGFELENHRNLTYPVVNGNLMILKALVEKGVPLSVNVFKEALDLKNPEIMRYLLDFATGKFKHYREKLENALSTTKSPKTVPRKSPRSIKPIPPNPSLNPLENSSPSPSKSVEELKSLSRNQFNTLHASTKPISSPRTITNSTFNGNNDNGSPSVTPSTFDLPQRDYESGSSEGSDSDDQLEYDKLINPPSIVSIKSPSRSSNSISIVSIKSPSRSSNSPSLKLVKKSTPPRPSILSPKDMTSPHSRNLINTIIQLSPDHADLINMNQELQLLQTNSPSLTPIQVPDHHLQITSPILRPNADDVLYPPPMRNTELSSSYQLEFEVEGERLAFITPKSKPSPNKTAFLTPRGNSEFKPMVKEFRRRKSPLSNLVTFTSSEVDEESRSEVLTDEDGEESGNVDGGGGGGDGVDVDGNLGRGQDVGDDGDGQGEESGVTRVESVGIR